MPSLDAFSDVSEVHQLLRRVGHAHEQALSNAVRYAQDHVQALQEQLASHGILEVETAKRHEAFVVNEEPQATFMIQPKSEVASTIESGSKLVDLGEPEEARDSVASEILSTPRNSGSYKSPGSSALKTEECGVKQTGSRRVNFGGTTERRLSGDSTNTLTTDDASQEIQIVEEPDFAGFKKGLNRSMSRMLNDQLRLREYWIDNPGAENNDHVIMLTNRKLAQFRVSKEGTTKNRFSIAENLGRVSMIRRFRCRCSNFIALPGSNWVLGWDVFRAVLIFYDTVMIPFSLSFQPKDNEFLTFMDWFAMLFWTFDMILTFFLGYIDKGRIVMAPMKICKRYLMTWFFLDIVVVAGDWFNNVGNATNSESGGMTGLGKLVRSLRAIRMLRLLRLLKLRRMMNELQDHISSEYTYLLLSLCKLLFFILFLNHGIACLWYWLGRLAFEEGRPSWVEKNEMQDTTIGYKYTTSLHWTLTQFTPASMEVMPRNTEERTMSVIVLIFALVAFSSFVASISTSMTALRNMNADVTKQFWMLRRFLKQHGVDRKVSRRILKYLEYIVEKKQGKVQQAGIKILGLLSGQLHEELTYELTCPHLMGSTFFQYILGFPLMDVVVRKICAVSVKKAVFATGDVVFYPGDQAENVFCFLHGSVEIVQDDEVLKPPLEELEWISEVAFWSSWKHTSQCRALRESEIISVGIQTFAQECRKNSVAWSLTVRYARRFLDVMTESSPGDVVRQERFAQAMQQLIDEEQRDLERWSLSNPAFQKTPTQGQQSSAWVMKQRMSAMIKERQETSELIA